MAIQLFGNPYNLQGGNQQLQGGYNPQQAANPQQTYGPVPMPKPVAAPKLAPKPVVAPKPAPQPKLVTTGLVGSAFSPYVGARPSPSNPNVAEFYRTDTNQALDQQGLFSYASSLGLGQINSFEQLKANAPQYVSTGQPTIESYQDPNQRLAQSAGLSNLSYEDYQKIVAGQSGLSQAEKDEIRKSLGIPDLESSLFTPPAKSTEQLYKDAYASAGLAELKQKIAALDAQIATKKQEVTDAQGNVNENPFLSENTRVGRNKRISDQAQLTIGNLIDQQNQYKDLYNSGINEVSNLITRQTADFSQNQQFTSQKLQYLLSKAEEQVTSKQAEKSGAALQYLPDYLKAKAQAQKPDTIGSNETGFYRWNPSTQTFEQIIAPKVTPNYQANPLTGELFNTKDGSTIGNGNTIAGLAQAILQNPAAYSQLTTAQQGAVNNYFAQNGQPIPTQLTPEQKNKIASVGVLQQTINSIEQLGNQIGWSGVGGLYQGSIQQFLAKNFGKGSQHEQMLRSYIGNLQATIAKERGGTSFTANEQALLEQYAPTINDSPSVIQSKLAALKQYFSSSIPSGGGSNPSDPLGLFSSAGNASASTPYLKTLGKVTGENGSSLWSYGLDVDLKKGDPVRSPVNGTVIAAAPNGGFGNQIKIRTNDGQEIWLSHLQSGSVKVGQVVKAGQIVGIGGNSGNTIAGKGSDGSHLDITMKDSNGKLLTAPQVKSFLDKIYV